MPEGSRSHYATSDFIGGVFRGATLAVVGHPLDTLKVRCQSHGGSGPRSLISFSRDFIRIEGFRGLYRGVAAPLFSNILSSPYYFFCYGWSKRLILGDIHGSRKPRELTTFRMTLIATLTGVLSTIVNGPTDLASKEHFTSSFQCAKTIYRNHGAMGFSQGLYITLMRNVLGDIAYFGVYELVRLKLLTFLKHDPKTAGKKRIDRVNFGAPEFWSTLVAGGLGGVAFWSSIYPLDMMKTRLQVLPYIEVGWWKLSHFEGDQSKGASAGTGTLKKNIRSFRHLFPGFTFCVLRAFIANACAFTAYEYGVQWAQRSEGT